MKTRSSIVLLLLLSVSEICSGAHEFDAEPALLILGNTTEQHVSPEILRELRTAGFRLEWLELRRSRRDWPRLLELIPQANVIVMMGAGVGNLDGSVNEEHAAYFEAVDAFARAGGGVLYFTAERYMPSYIAGAVFLKRWNARMGVEWIHNDTAVEKTAWSIPFAYTGDVRESPVTAGVNGLWHPTFWTYRHGSARQSRVVRLDESLWQVVLTGGPDAYSQPRPSDIPFIQEHTAPEGYTASPPLWAIRELERGRVALSGITYAYFLGKAALSTLDSIVWNRGLHDRPSDGKRLLLNTLNWLAEPSMSMRGPGSMPDNPGLLTARDEAPVETPLDWTRQRFADRPEPRLKALIGARTTRTTGKASVTEWREAARAAGLDVVVFLEPLERLSREAYGTLRAECGTLTDDTLWLIPGFTYANAIGARSYVFDPDLPFPPERFLTADGSRWNDGAGIARNNDPGQLAWMRGRWLYDVCARRAMTGWYDFDRCPIPTPDLGQYDTLPVIEAQDLEEHRQAFAVYQQALRDKQFPQPLALQFLDDPALLSQPLWFTYFHFTDLAGLRAWFETGYSSRMSFEPRHSAGNGPEILNWEALGRNAYQWTNADFFVWQNARRVMRLRARHAPGIREVRIYDSDRLVRRFLPNAPEVDLRIAADSRDRQAEFFAEIIGVDGRRAVSGAHAQRAHALQQINCSDRNNQLPSSHQRREDGSWLRLGQLAACPDKRTGFMRVQPSRVFSNDERLGLGAFDGAAPHAGYPTVNEALRLRIRESYHEYESVRQSRWGEEANGSHHIASVRVAGMDAIVADREVTRIFADGVPVIHVWSTMWRIEPRVWSHWTQRRWVFRCKPDQPPQFGRWDYRLTLQREVSYDPDQPLGVHGPEILPGEATLWSIGPAGAELEPVAEGHFGQQVAGGQERYDFGPGAWLACMDSPGGGAIVFSLTPGLKLATTRGSGNRPRGWTLGFAPGDSPTRAGASCEFSVVVAGVPRFVPEHSDRVAVREPSTTAQRVKQQFGLGRVSACPVQWLRGEEVAADFWMQARAEQGAVVVRLGAIEEPVGAVPLVAEGMNPNWTVKVHDSDTDDSRPVAQFENRAVTVCVPDREQTLFLGHPILADRSELSLTLVRSAGRAWDLEMHNPSDAPLQARVFSHPDWPVFRFAETVVVPAGSSLYRRVGNE